MSNGSDMLRQVNVATARITAVAAAGTAVETPWVDVSDAIGPVVVVAESASHASISGTLSIQHATSATGAGSATVTDDSDFPGGRDANGANATGGNDWAANTSGSVALSYSGERRYIRAHVQANNATNASITHDVSVAVLKMPQVPAIR